MARRLLISSKGTGWNSLRLSCLRSNELQEESFDEERPSSKVTFPCSVPVAKALSSAGSVVRRPRPSPGFSRYALSALEILHKRLNPSHGRLIDCRGLILAFHRRYLEIHQGCCALSAQIGVPSLGERKATAACGLTRAAKWSELPQNGVRSPGTMILYPPIVWPPGSVLAERAQGILVLPIAKRRNTDFVISRFSMRDAVLTAFTVKTGPFANA